MGCLTERAVGSVHLCEVDRPCSRHRSRLGRACRRGGDGLLHRGPEDRIQALIIATAAYISSGDRHRRPADRQATAARTGTAPRWATGTGSPAVRVLVGGRPPFRAPMPAVVLRERSRPRRRSTYQGVDEKVQSADDGLQHLDVVVFGPSSSSSNSLSAIRFHSSVLDGHEARSTAAHCVRTSGTVGDSW